MSGRSLFTGVCTALVTPFTKDGVDEEALRKLIDTQLQAGVEALLPCGTTGEPSTLTDAEWAQAVAITVSEARGRALIIAGTGSNNPRRAVEKAARARELGAQAQLCVTPYYNKATQRGLIAFFRHIADHSALPMILYNVPARTGVNMLPETVKALCAHPGVAGLKEASGNLAQAAEILRTCPLPVYCGSDEIIAPMLRLGASGAISVVSNILPAAVRSMVSNALAGRFGCADDRQQRLLPLIAALFCEVSPAPAKAALEMMGVCSGDVRLPLVRMENENLQKLKAILIAEGLTQG